MSKMSLAITALPKETIKILVRLGLRLRLARQKRDLSFAALADEAGVSFKTLKKIELGAPTVSLRLVIAVMLAMDLWADIEELARGEPRDEEARLKENKDLHFQLSCMSFADKQHELLRRIGLRMRMMRKAAGLSIAAVCNCMYASPVTIGKIENGSPSISIGITAAMLSCLRHEGDLDKIALPALDKTGLGLEAHRHSLRKYTRRKK
jgi:transcriptional regulator with XRE-family HTH domain